MRICSRVIRVLLPKCPSCRPFFTFRGFRVPTFFLVSCNLTIFFSVGSLSCSVYNLVWKISVTLICSMLSSLIRPTEADGYKVVETASASFSWVVKGVTTLLMLSLFLTLDLDSTHTRCLPWHLKNFILWRSCCLSILYVVGKVCLNAPIGMWFKVMYTGNWCQK